MQLTTIDEVLGFAIEREEEAARLYAGLAETVRNPGMREALLELAAEEGRHKARLLEVRAGGVALVSGEKVPDLRITETLVEPVASPGMSYREVLVLAMKAEKAAYRLYCDLAAATADAGLAEVFTALANEEAKHKLRLEVEYDDQILEGT